MQYQNDIITDGVTPDFNNIIIALNNNTALLNAVGTKFLSLVRSNFKAPTFRNQPWKPYSKKYAKKVGTGVPTLFRSGNLMESNKIQGFVRNGVMIGTRGIPWAAAHQFGNPKNKLPARPYYPVISNGNGNVLNSKAMLVMFNEIVFQFNKQSKGVLPLNVDYRPSVPDGGDPHNN